MNRSKRISVISALVFLLILLFTWLDDQLESGIGGPGNEGMQAAGPGIVRAPGKLIDTPAQKSSQPGFNAVKAEMKIPAAGNRNSEVDSILAAIVESESLPAEDALPRLQPLLAHPLARIRIAAYEALVDMTHPQRAMLLSMAHDDAETEIRVLALEGLGMTPTYDALPHVEYGLMDAVAEVRIAAIDALIEFDDPTVVHSLSAVIYDPDPLVRRHAVSALGEIGGRDARAYLEQSRYDTDRRTRAIALEILAELE